MSTLERIVEELKTLPADRLERAADFVHRLRNISRAERNEALRRTAGTLTKDEADSWEQAINEDCEQVDEDTW